LQHYDAHCNEVTHIDFHPSGAFLISTSKDSSIKVWDLTAGNQMYTLHGHEKPTTCVSFSPKGGSFATTSEDALVLLWRTNFDKLLHEKSAKTVQNFEKPGKVKMFGPTPREKYPKASKMQSELYRSKPRRKKPHNGIQQKTTAGKKILVMDSSYDPVTNELSTTLQSIVEQMNLVTQTMGMFEERLSHTESILATLDQRLGNIEASRTIALSDAHLKFIPTESTEPDSSISTIQQNPCQVPVTLPSVAKLLRNEDEC
jgi:centriolar protein POC1